MRYPSRAVSPMSRELALNADVAKHLEEVARLLEEQGAAAFRVRAYRNAASTVRHLTRPIMDIIMIEGLEGLDRLPGIGPTLARSIRQLALTGRLPMLDRLRGESDPVTVLASVPGVGRTLAHRLHDERGIETLEQLEGAAHDGTLAVVPGFGPKRVTGIRDALAARLGRRWREPRPQEEPEVADLLEVDRLYRERAQSGKLRLIAPRRFNPEHRAWLPVLHYMYGDRHYTALFSNTALAHKLGKTDDWVVLYYDGTDGEQQCTVVTATSGILRGKRIVRGRESECEAYYRWGPA
ncbi:MAG TPA: helix-hairpin-helix domain-containing protein [Gemmatimonadaceae bacterium]